VNEAIQYILQNKDIPGEPENFKLYKLDRNTPGNKILLNNNDIIQNLVNNGVNINNLIKIIKK